MPDLHIWVLQYGIRYYGQGGSGTNRDFRAWLDLFGPGTSLIGRILFWKPEALITSPKQDRLDQNGLIYGNMSITEIGGVIDMLRSEKGILLVWNEGRKQVRLGTGGEPVGEEET